MYILLVISNNEVSILLILTALWYCIMLVKNTSTHVPGSCMLDTNSNKWMWTCLAQQFVWMVQNQLHQSLVCSSTKIWA